MQEIWKPIPGWSMYEVSSHGRVRRLPGIKRLNGVRGKQSQKHYGGFLNPYYSNEYLVVTLTDLPRRKSIQVHVLMLLAFIGPQGKGMLGRHLDDIPEHNIISNLAWGTKTDNALDAIKNGKITVGEACHWSKLTTSNVKEIRRLYVNGSKSKGGKALAARFGVSRSAISLIVNGLIWKHENC